VEKVRVHTAKHKFFDNVSRPFAIRGNPQVSAQFSIPYTVATAILRRDVFLDAFEERVIRSPEFQEMASRVEVIADHEIVPGSLGPVTVEIFTREGKCLTSRVDEFKGHPENPVTREEIVEKFRKCAVFALRRYGDKEVQQMIDAILGLEELKSVEELMNLLGGGEVT
jgi:2-methylcitrate dehydratase PrpD